MNIGLVLSKTPGYSETFFLSKIEGLKTSGFDVTLFVQKTNPSFNLCNVIEAPKTYKNNPLLQLFKVIFELFGFLIRFPKRLGKFITLERQVHRTWTQIIKNIYNNAHLLKSDMDWLHFGFATMAVQSEHVAKAIGAKMAVSFRGFDIDVYPENHPNCYDVLWNQVDKVHSISDYLLKKGYQLGLSSETHFDIITPAIDVSQFTRDHYVFSKNTIKIVTVARLHPIKDLKFAIDAMAILKTHAIYFEYHIIGDGQEHDVLQARINNYELDPVVTLLGKKSHVEVGEALKNADIYLQYSASEGFCNAVLEAQAVGILCLVSDGGALPENVIHKETGWVIPKKNPEALANAILKVINLTDEVKRKISGNAQERVRSSFNLNTQREKFKAFYEDI
jgi:colanic acid/amylovoran biosynthesis glycosyltransferase